MLIMVLSPVKLKAQYREEIGTLESMYEVRAKTLLNTVLRPHEYSLVISMDIDRDEERLGKLQAEIDNDFLPGMPGGLSSENPAFANQLYELKNKIDIHLILSNKISKEKEATIKSLLSMKLHLDEKNGDKLTVDRTDLPSLENETSADKLPELSWKMWGMILGLSLMTLAGLLLYWNRKSKMALQKQNELNNEVKNKSSEAGSKDHDLGASITLPELLQANKHSDESFEDEESQLNEIDSHVLISEQKTQILSLVTQYPEATSQALAEHFLNNNEKDLLILCETFGWEISKKLFSGFSPRVWGKLGLALQKQIDKFTENEFLTGLESCKKVILKKFLEIGEFDSKNPFGFFWKLDNFDRKKLIESEGAKSIAIICCHANKDQVAELMDSLEQHVAEAVTMSIATLESISELQVKSIIDSMTARLKTIKENPEKETDGIRVAAQLLRSLPAEKEHLFFEKLASESPQEALKIRKTILLFADVKYIPSEIINDALALLELSTIVNALRNNYFPEVTSHIFKALPPKKSYMIQRDLELSVLISDKQIGVSQREMINSIMTVLKIKNIELLYLLSNLDDIYSSNDLVSKVA